MNDEKIFFKNGDITVTNSRFVAGAQTFAIRNITSVKAEKVEVNNSTAGILILVGIIIFVIGLVNTNWAALIGLVIAAAGIYWIWNQESPYAVVLTTSSGEVKAYQSNDREFISGIVSGLNDAIVANG